MFEQSNAIYRNLTNQQKEMAKDISLHNINGLDIPFSKNWKRIAINLSGGADSACLTYLLCKIITENNFNCKIDIITHVRCWSTRPWQQPISVNVFKKLKNMFPSIIDQRHENFIAPPLEHGASGLLFPNHDNTTMHSGDQVSVSEFNQYCFYRYNLDAIFNATSANPRGLDFPKKMLDREKTADSGSIADLVVAINDNNRFIFHPFRFVEKSWIIAQYYIFDVVNLLDTTRSCEGDIKSTNIKNTIPNLNHYTPEKDVPTCGTCFWCLEREWAYSKLDETLEKIKNV
jgi:hypothetical protein